MSRTAARAGGGPATTTSLPREGFSMSMRTGLAIGLMAACMLPGFAYAEGGVQTQKDITWGLGLEIAQAAIAECAKRKVAISVAVVDRAGRVRVFIAFDTQSPRSLELPRRDGCTAAHIRRL